MMIVSSGKEPWSWFAILLLSRPVDLRWINVWM
jgi:hypothetical protein